jgi:hypothetical protein
MSKRVFLTLIFAMISMNACVQIDQKSVESTPTPKVDTISTPTQTQSEQKTPTVTETVSPNTSCIKVSESPEGGGYALQCGDKTNSSLTVFNKSGQQWVLQLKDYVLEEEMTYGDIPLGRISPEEWSKDGNYFYFSPKFNGSGGGTCFYGLGPGSLYRLDLLTGEVTIILSPRPAWKGYLFKFSPDREKLVYSYFNLDRPVILDLNTGVESSIDIGDYSNGNHSTGDYTWSPDSKSLAFAVCEADENYVTIERSAIEIFTSELIIPIKVLEKANHFLSIEKNDDSSSFSVVDEKWDSPENFTEGYSADETNYFIFDWNSERLVETTPIP